MIWKNQSNSTMEGWAFPRWIQLLKLPLYQNGSWLSLYGRELLADDAAVSSDGSGFDGFALAHNVGPAIEIDQSIEQASTAGATLSKAGQKTSWGGYSGYFKDPEGFLWKVALNPFFWVESEDENE